MVHCHNIELSFQDKEIFSGFNLNVNKGESVCLYGPSGKGKSTLLKMLQGYIHPDSGAIFVNGYQSNSENIQIIRDHISWIPQNINLPVDNASALLHLLEANNNKNKAVEYIEMLGLEAEFINKSFTKVSGGQKQRIVIAVCLSLNKDILLLDEPTSSLDEQAIDCLVKTIKSLNGKTIISASHNKSWLSSNDHVVNL